MSLIYNGQTITTGTWLRCLKVLNPKLRVCSFENSNRLAGLYLINKQGEWEDICGVDKTSVPAYATFDAGGHIIKSGWRRVIWVLLQNGYTSPEAAKKVCRGFFDSNACKYDRFVGGTAGDPIDNKLVKFAMSATDAVKNEEGEWVEVLKKDQILEVAADIQAKDSEVAREERNHDKWFLEKWKKDGGGVNDRPKY